MKPIYYLSKVLSILLLSLYINSFSQIPSGIVYPVDTLFMVNNTEGNAETFYFSGTNNYYLMYKPMKMVEDILDGMICLNQKVVRMWFFMDGANVHDGYNLQPNPYEYNEAGFKHIDSVMAELAERNLKCIAVFVNYWSDFGGMAQYASWTGGSSTNFYGSTEMKNIYKEYVRHWVTRTNTVTGVAYANDPTIFSWQLTNEARCSNSTVDEYVTWAGEMSDFIRSLDPNHMISMGDEGLFAYSYNEINQINAERQAVGLPLITSDWPYSGSQGDWVGLLSLPNISFGTVHNYATDNWGYGLEWGKVWTQYHIEIAHEMNKPCVMEEYDKAYSGNWSETADQERAQVMQAYTDIIYNKNMAGDCSWMLVGLNYTEPVEPGYTLDVGPNCTTTVPVDQIWLYRVKWPGDGHQYSRYDPYTSPVLKSHGERMLNKNIQDAPQSFSQTSPANNAVEVSIIPSFQWESALYATNYSIIVSKNANLSNPVIDHSNILSNSYTIKASEKFDYETRYYWAVNAHNYIGQTEAINKGISFMTQSPPPPVDNFNLLEPTGENIGRINTIFSWQPASNADYYNLMVSINSDLSNPVINVTDLPEASYTSSVTLEPATTYYWSVTAYNSLSSSEADNSPFSFETELPVASIDNFESYTDNSSLTSSWQRNTGGNDLTLTIETDIVGEGLQSMQMDYNFSSYCGATKSVNNNWSGYNGISFWLLPDGSGRDFLFQFQESSGEYWETSIQLAGTEAAEQFIPWTAFSKPGWDGSGNGTIDREAIQQVAFYFGGSGGSGTVYIDNIKASLSNGKYLSVTPSDLLFSAHTGIQHIIVQSNINWNANTDQNWIDLSPTSGINDGVVTVSVNENVSYDNRNGIITLSGEGLTKSINVMQEGIIAENIALNKTAIASSNDGYADDPSSVTDGNTSTRWASEWSDPQWLYIDLEQIYTITRAVFLWEAAYGSAYEVQVSNDGSNWTSIYNTSNGDGGTDDIELSGTGRYIRIYGLARGTSWGYSLYEFEVYGMPSGINQPPVADAGDDITVTDIDNNGSEVVSLNASASYDPDGTITNYSWSIPGGGTLSGINPSATIDVGNYNITLTVTDNDGAVATDEVSIIVKAGSPVTLLYEAEEASLTDVTIHDDTEVSAGKYVYMKGSGSVEWTVDVTSAGDYEIDFGYYLPFSSKVQHLNVNGTYVEDITFDGVTGVWQKLTRTVSLNSGINTITITKYWGWMYFDYIEIGQLKSTIAKLSLHDINTNKISLYPVPLKDEAYFKFMLETSNHVLINIYNLKGDQVFTKYMGKLGKGIHTMNLNTTEINNNNVPGLYLYQVIIGKNVFTDKFLLE